MQQNSVKISLRYIFPNLPFFEIHAHKHPYTRKHGSTRRSRLQINKFTLSRPASGRVESICWLPLYKHDVTILTVFYSWWHFGVSQELNREEKLVFTPIWRKSVFQWVLPFVKGKNHLTSRKSTKCGRQMRLTSAPKTELLPLEQLWTRSLLCNQNIDDWNFSTGVDTHRPFCLWEK